MGEREGPQPEIGSGVRNSAQAVLDRVDSLLHRHVAEVKFLTGDNFEAELRFDYI